MDATVSELACAQSSEECDEFLKTLPKLTPTQIPAGDSCPICLNLFSAILEEERVGGTSVPKERLGVTRLQCGHIFCMADITEWIHTSRGSCPTCRDLFLVIPEPSDDESSDGGEYIPGSDSVADDMMDGETWTDEEEIWTEGEDMSLDEGITEGETDSSWEDGASGDIDEQGVPAVGQLLQSSMDIAIITEAGEESFLIVPQGDPECDQIKTQLIQWRTRIHQIEMQNWTSNEDETRSKIREGLYALRALKPKIDAIDRDTSAKVSFVHSALAAMQEIYAEIESKLEMMHEVDYGSFARDIDS